MGQPALQRVHVAGFRSLRDVTLNLGPVTILIGPSGAGKSNLLSALEMVRLLAHDSLQHFARERGGVHHLMHCGTLRTPAFDIVLEFENTEGYNAYSARLGCGASEGLVFLQERAGFRSDAGQPWRWSDLGAGHQESRLGEAAERDATAKAVRWLLRRLDFYHFRDTSPSSPLRTRTCTELSGRHLRPDGSNLATFLQRIRSSKAMEDRASWLRISGSIKRVAPFISRLSLLRGSFGAKLEWIDETGAKFGPAHLSDGTLRALALIAALAQPESGLPLLCGIDEPELSLHPVALDVLCGLISSVSTRHQIIVATQYPALLDHFEPGQVVVAERSGGATQLRRLDEARLEGWLEDYTLAELYDKNVLGGR